MRVGPSRTNVLMACMGLVLASSPGRALSAICVASASGVAFGSYDPTSTSEDKSAGTVTVSCTTLVSVMVSYTIRLNRNGTSGFAPRKMGRLFDLNYNLYTSASLSRVWGDGTAGTTTVFDSYLLGVGTVNRTYNVYGGVPAGQNVPPGAYGDTIVVTVSY